MNIKKGDDILVTDFFGDTHRRIVWRVSGDDIFVTSEKGVASLEQGKTDIVPIPVPRESVKKL